MAIFTLILFLRVQFSCLSKMILVCETYLIIRGAVACQPHTFFNHSSTQVNGLLFQSNKLNYLNKSHDILMLFLYWSICLTLDRGRGVLLMLGSHQPHTFSTHSLQAPQRPPLPREVGTTEKVYIKAKARIWPRLSHLCRVCSTAVWANPVADLYGGRAANQSLIYSGHILQLRALKRFQSC